ncbi:sugar ABC transporter permease [Paenibacillus sp. S150]|uniref:ABC transporter permease n=1 Tax=Paenibacillus sp. S150 TaxID=2749826 RepID=UPI001C560BDC|nr:ABC transporter permease subunit [Paenibacillus sp. S150]MBW4080022.1 sugar ABC transporter permease [Paenibacillus sp. S150]
MASSAKLQYSDSTTARRPSGILWKEIVKHKYLYLLLTPLVIFYIIFSYIPMYGVLLAFKEFDYSKGIIGSPWNHFANFSAVFGNPDFWTAFRNTILISMGRLIIEFPIPIVLALLLNEISKGRLTRVFQTVFTFPHFISWVVLSGIIIGIFSDQGLYNQVLTLFGAEKASVLTSGPGFTVVLFISNIWKEAGWSCILYLAAIAGINPELYEAVSVDGANRFQQMRAITWPVLKSTAAILLILAVGNVMNGGFDQIFNLYNSAVYAYSDIIDTFVYRSAFTDATGFGFSTTVGLLKSAINFALLFGANYIVVRFGKEEGL